MADIRTVIVDTSLGLDYAQSGSLLAEDAGLDTAVLISLFTDRRAGEDDVLPGGTDDRRGVWMDAYAAVKGDLMGSRLWLLDRAKLLPETLLRVRDYCEEALAWLQRDGVAKRITVEAWIASRHPLGVIAGVIEVIKPDGSQIRYEIANLWSAV